MTTGITLTQDGKSSTINVEQIVWVEWNGDNNAVIIHVTNGGPLTFTKLTDRDKDGLKRMMRISPT